MTEHDRLWFDAELVVRLAVSALMAEGVKPDQVIVIIADRRSVAAKVLGRWFPKHVVDDAPNRLTVATFARADAAYFRTRLLGDDAPANIDGVTVVVLDAENRSVLSVWRVRESRVETNLPV